MRIVFRIQRDLALWHREQDSGEWVAVCCRRGLEQLIGRRLRTGQTITADLSLKEIVASPTEKPESSA